MEKKNRGPISNFMNHHYRHFNAQGDRKLFFIYSNEAPEATFNK
jgi:hypothetical protein